MKININSGSRVLVDELELNPCIGDFFNTIVAMRTKNIKSLRDFVALTRGSKKAIAVIREHLYRPDSIKVAKDVMACYKSHLETGRVFPYDMYLSHVKSMVHGDVNLTIKRDTNDRLAVLAELSTFRFDTTKDIIESSSAIYVIMSAIFGWENIVVSPIVPHIT